VSLYGLSKDVQDLLHAKNFPLKVHYGPERMHREGYPENVVVFERDHEGSDAVQAAQGAQRNPRKLGARVLASVVHIYARNSKAGARIEDHHELCEKFVDAVHCAIMVWAKASGAINCPVSEAKYLSASDRLSAAKLHVPDAKAEAVEQWPGVVYRIKFGVPRALLDLNYAGDGLPTTELGGIASRTDAYGAGGVGSGETGCGA
jgi:hypothetical protein